jgi:hypothetical protein
MGNRSNLGLRGCFVSDDGQAGSNPNVRVADNPSRIAAYGGNVQRFRCVPQIDRCWTSESCGGSHLRQILQSRANRQ